VGRVLRFGHPKIDRATSLSVRFSRHHKGDLMHSITRTLRRALSGITEMGRRVLGLEPSEEVFRARLTQALRDARGIEIDDVYPAGSTARDEVHR
jgi:hypothetical protein